MKGRTFVTQKTERLVTEELERLSSGAPYIRLKADGKAQQGISFSSDGELAAFADRLKARFVTPPIQTPVPTADIPAGWKLYWEDNFDGPAGPLDPAKWVNRGLGMDGHLGLCASKPENIFLDGFGNCIIRTKRERVEYGTKVREYSTGMACTFQYGWPAAGNTAADGAWPPANIRSKWPSPHRIEVVMRLPDLGGFWGGAWMMAVDQHRETQGVPEIDFAELRRSSNRHDGHQHIWWPGAGGVGASEDASKIWNGAILNPANLLVPHRYWAEVYADRVVYGIDESRNQSSWGRACQYGLLLNGGIGLPGDWGAAGGTPVGDGPWDVQISNARVLVPA